MAASIRSRRYRVFICTASVFALWVVICIGQFRLPSEAIQNAERTPEWLNTAIHNTERNREVPNSANHNTERNREVSNSAIRNTERNREVSNSAIRNTERNREVPNSAIRNTERNREVPNSAIHNTERNREVSNSAIRNTERNREVSNSAIRNTERNREVSNSAIRNTERNREVPNSAIRNTIRNQEVPDRALNQNYERMMEVVNTAIQNGLRNREVPNTVNRNTTRNKEVTYTTVTKIQRNTEFTKTDVHNTAHNTEMEQTATQNTALSRKVSNTSIPYAGRKMTVAPPTGKRFNSWTGLWATLWQKELPQALKMFHPVMRVEEYFLSMDIFTTFVTTLENHGIRYFLYGGTLIGSMRHHGPIMWDDDMDIGVFCSDLDQIKEALKRLEPDYILKTTSGLAIWKFYSKHSKQDENLWFPWRWPFLDIFCMEVEDGYVHDATWPYASLYFPYRFMFPLTKRPFAGLDVYAPRCPSDFVSVMYNYTDCVSRFFDHKNAREMPSPTVAINCSKVEPFYPVVSKQDKRELILESLWLNGQLLQEFTSEKCPVSVE